MSEQLNYQINVTGNAGESVGSLKKQLREAQNEVAALSDKFGATSQQAIEAAKRAAELKDRIGDAKALTDAFNPDAKFRALTSSLSGVAGGFAAVQGAIGLFGSESKELEKQLLKVQSALALSQGLQSIGESIDSFKQLGAVIQQTTVFQKANALANTVTAASMRALGIAVDTTAVSFRVLKTAIAATGIGLLIVALGELVNAFSNYTSAADRAKKKQDDLNESIKKGADVALQAELQFIENEKQLEIARAKNRGASEKEIFDLEQSFRKSKANAQVRYWNEIKDIDKEGAEKTRAEVEKINTEGAVAELNFQTEQNNKRAENNKKNAEKAKQQREKEIAENKKLEAEEEQRRKDRDERESAAQQVQIDAFRSTLSARERDVLAAEDELEKKKGDLIRAGVTDFTLVQEQYRLKLIEINKKYDDEELRKVQEKIDKEKEVQDVNKQRLLEAEQLRAITLEEQKAAELSALSSEYQIKYDLAVKNGEDLVALRELFAAKEFAIEKKFTDDVKKEEEAKKQAKLNTLNETAAIIGAFATLAGEQTKLSKGLTLAQIGIDTASAISSLTKNSEANPTNAVTFGASGVLQFATGLIRILANVKRAKDLLSSSSSATPSFSAPSISRTAPVVPQTQQAQLTQLNQATINAIGNQAIRAYVVETDITSNQKRVQAIKQRARFS